MALTRGAVSVRAMADEDKTIPTKAQTKPSIFDAPVETSKPSIFDEPANATDPSGFEAGGLSHTLVHFSAQLEDLRDTSLTLELILSTFGPHPRVNLGRMGGKASLF